VSKKFFLTDVSAAEVDDTCGMKYWFRYLEDGKGIINKDQVVPQLIEEAVRHDFRAIATMEDISPENIQASINETLSGLTEDDKKDQKKMELLYRRLGWAAAWALFMEGDIRGKYDSVPIDDETVLDVEPLFVLSNPYRILINKLNGDVIYNEIEASGVPYPTDKWSQSWVYRVRLHAGIAAAQQALNLRAARMNTKVNIIFGQMIGLQSGFYSSVDGRLVHPYVWGKRNKVTGAWVPNCGFDMAGDEWENAPVWDFEGGIVEWVQRTGSKVATQQFVMSPHVRLNQTHLNAWVAGRIHREREINVIKDIALTNPDLRNVHFQKRTMNCRPQDGLPCQYIARCWLPSVKSGQYIPVNSQ
jgi:hypothetical protein